MRKGNLYGPDEPDRLDSLASQIHSIESNPLTTFRLFKDQFCDKIEIKFQNRKMNFYT